MSKRAGPGALLSLGSRVGAWDFTGSGFTGEFKTEEQELKAQREKTSGPSRQSLKSTRVSKAKGPGWGSGHVFMRDAPYPRCPEVDALQSQPVRHLLYKKKKPRLGLRHGDYMQGDQGSLPQTRIYVQQIPEQCEAGAARKLREEVPVNTHHVQRQPQ